MWYYIKLTTQMFLNVLIIIKQSIYNLLFLPNNHQIKNSLNLTNPEQNKIW